MIRMVGRPEVLKPEGMILMVASLDYLYFEGMIRTVVR
jgi:hypothetical protein